MKALRRSYTSSSPATPSSPSVSSSPSRTPSSSSSSSWIHLRSVLPIVNSSSPSSCSSDRHRLRSPWSRRRSKRALTPRQWKSLFTAEGKLRDHGVGFLKKVRSNGIDPSIRAEVWLFLLGLYELNSSEEDRKVVRAQKRKEYEKLRRHCRLVLNRGNATPGMTNHIATSENCCNGRFLDDVDECSPSDIVSTTESTSSDDNSPFTEYADETSLPLLEIYNYSRRMTNTDIPALNSESSDSDSCIDLEDTILFPTFGSEEETPEENLSSFAAEDFATWQRIIRLDAIRADSDWANYSLSQSAVSEDKARRSAESVGLKDYDLLEPCRVFHAARLVAVLEVYALYDPEIGYCQGMSDLLSPIIAVIPKDHEAFWCFVGFMKKARHNFRLDEIGIQRQLNIVSKIIRHKDSQLYRHLENLEAEDCRFVYRMVLVMFRRELTFEQTLCLWEVMWADQAAIRAGVGKSSWSRIRQQAPPTDDLLLYAIGALVLQRKLIIQKYSSMDEIVKECNSIGGQLDLWKLLDDAHDLVVNLHDKIES